MRQWRSILSEAGHYTFVFARTLATIYVVSKYGVFFAKIQGPSMFPTFSGQGEIVIAEAVTPLLGKTTPGDVVICTRPVAPGEHVVKRVTALAGDTVILYPDRDNAEMRKVEVPKGHVWIQGDNMLHSLDSREYGAVPSRLVKGRVLAQIWPSFRWTGSDSPLPYKPVA